MSKQGTPQGTLREIAQRFLAQTADTVTLRYRHSLLGAELVAAGVVVASREYTYNCPSDPFRLPRTLRAIAFSEGGHDMDDAADATHGHALTSSVPDGMRVVSSWPVITAPPSSLQ